MTPKHYHFSGICGTAMASLAVLLKKRGHKITGSDENIYPPMSTFLEENQVEITEGYQEEHLQPHPDFVIIGNALSRGNPEVEYALEQHLNYFSMSELLKNEFIRGNTSIVITGTHGKTTTTSLIAHLLEISEKKPGFFVGGIPENFQISARDTKKGGYFVVEGDEYDTSLFDKRSKFFHYLPDRMIINNLEFDHADIFSSLDEIKRSFVLCLRQIPKNGLILANGDDEDVMEVARQGFSSVVSFGFEKHCDAVIHNCRTILGEYGMLFDLAWKKQVYSFQIPMLGHFNVRNATASILLCLHEGVSPKTIQKGLSSFKHVRRRMQLVSSDKNILVFDDFAHHPTAIQASLQALREAYPESQLHAVFEPRSNTCIRRFHQESMTKALTGADRITFYKLHRGEMIPEEDRLNIPQILTGLQAMGKKATYFDQLEHIADHVAQQALKGDIVLVMSQGSFGGVQKMIAERIRG